MNKWAELLGVPYPDCNRAGHCCKCATSSVSVNKLFAKARKGDEFARDFLTIFVPHKDTKTAEKVSPSVVQQSIDLINKTKNSEISTDNIVFYKCRFIAENNHCVIYEDRPALCRSYPDSPFHVFSEPPLATLKWSLKIFFGQLKHEIKKIRNFSLKSTERSASFLKVAAMSRVVLMIS